MSERPRPVCTILGGPNGSGKSSIVAALQPRGTFVNADAIAKSISPTNPETVSLAAGRRVIQQLDALTRERLSFVYETTLSGLQPIAVMRRAQEAGYEIGLVFIILATVELNIQRVAQRVARGGHDIPEPVIRRRYNKAFGHLPVAVSLADETVILDNTGLTAQILLRLDGRHIVENRLRSDEPAHLLVADALRSSCSGEDG